MTTLQGIRHLGKRLAVGSSAIFILVFATLPAYVSASADNPDTGSGSTAAVCNPVVPASSGNIVPTGSSASTYTFNKCTGLWENSYYTWSPATRLATPIIPLVYSCNTATWQWQTLQWQYNAAKDKYEQVSVTVTQLPSGAIISSTSQTICAPPPPPVVTPSQSSLVPNALTQNGISGPSSSNNISGTTDNNLSLNNNNVVTVSNGVNSSALTGNSSVQGNTIGGSATSGNAQTIANVINLLQSSSALGAGTATFVANVNGDVNGNLMINPNLLQPAGGNTTLNSTNNLTVNTNNTNQMTNDINLDSTSGNADVTNNTTGGDATSGSASAVANVVNLINSMIGSNQSFMGVININGNLTGNILVPQNFLDSLLASNGPGASTTVAQSVMNTANINTTNNQSINNNINSSATSGDATVANNTSGGSATTGSAGTNVTILNLTGNQVVGSNSLLVFVNVLGKWVGLIMNAPAGTTAASLGGNITSNTTNTINANSTNNDSINNNINAKASSGDATVSNNTKGGNATSGNASTAVNILNMDNTQYNLSGWFGILFINVFGNWIGGFGVDTPPPIAQPDNTNQTSGNEGTPVANVFRFDPLPTSATSTGGNSSNTSISNLDAQLVVSKLSKVMGDSTRTNIIATTVKPLTATPDSKASYKMQVVIGGSLVALGIVIVVVERFMRSPTKPHVTKM